MKKITFLLFSIFCFASIWQSNAQFTENFDSGTTMPAGWSVINQGGANEWTIFNVGATVAHSGTNVARIQYNSTAHDDYLISPAINVTAGVNDKISFFIKSINSGFLEPYEVLLSTTTNTASTDFSVILQSEETSTQDWEQKAFFLNDYVGETVYIAIRATGTDEDRLAVDDFVNDAIPSCPAPSALTASNPTPNSVDLSWTENGTSANWDIEWGADGFTPTGTPNVNDTGDNPYELTGLSADTNYEFYVRSDCGADDSTDVSVWAGPFSFATTCDAIGDFNEGFESYAANEDPICWSENLGGSTGYIYVSTSDVNTGTKALRSGNNGSTTAVHYIISPPLLDMSAGTHRLQFSVYGSPTITLEVGRLSNPLDMGTFTSVQTIPLTTTHTDRVVNFNTPNTDSYFAFKMTYSSTYYSVSLDDVIWEALPSGPPNCSAIVSPMDTATNISVTPTLTWNTNIDATGYKLKIGTTDGGDEFLAETDLMDVTSYNVMSVMDYETLYYATLTPYNANGNAVSCPSISFTTQANPNYGGGLDGEDPNQPNSGGYYFSNDTPDASSALSQPTYNWIDPIVAGHTEITTWTSGNDDDGYFTIPDLGFDFNFYGNTYRTSNTFINSNGAVLFETGVTSTGSAFTIPNVAEAGNFIAACWQDLDDNTDGKIYYGGTADKFVITWWHYYDYQDLSEYITFQVILHANGNIIIQYNDTESSADELGNASNDTTIFGDALVGIENSAEDKGIQYRNNGSGGPIFGSPLALGFTTDASTLSVISQNELNDFTYYPNPVKNTLNLRAQSNIQNVSIYNMLGQEVLRTAPNNVDSTLDMSALQTGAYFVKVTINDRTETIRVVKQ